MICRKWEKNEIFWKNFEKRLANLCKSWYNAQRWQDKLAIATNNFLQL